VLFYGALLTPNALNHPDNFVEANALVTPTHIVPEWYFLPFYAILRAIPNKLFGVLAMVAAIICLFALPLMRKVNFLSYNIADVALEIYFYGFLFCYAVLGYLGSMPAEAPYVFAAQVFTIFYFLLFFVPFMANNASRILTAISARGLDSQVCYAILPLLFVVREGTNSDGMTPNETFVTAVFFSTAAIAGFVLAPTVAALGAGYTMTWSALAVGLGKGYIVYGPFQAIYLLNVWNGIGPDHFRSEAYAKGIEQQEIQARLVAESVERARLARLEAHNKAIGLNDNANANANVIADGNGINNCDSLSESFFSFDFSTLFAVACIPLPLVIVALLTLWSVLRNLLICPFVNFFFGLSRGSNAFFKLGGFALLTKAFSAPFFTNKSALQVKQELKTKE
jgi:hypothetical protein